MANINKEIDKTLELLLSRSNLEKDNVLKLSKDITDIETEIENSTIKSYTLVKDSLDKLKNAIKKNSEIIDNEEWNKIDEKAKIKAKYYTTLSSYKDQLLNYHIDNIDDLLLLFDSYTNEKIELIKSITNIFVSTKNETNNFFNNIINIIYNSLFKYHEILIKYQKMYSEYFRDIEKDIKKLSKIYLNLFDNHHEEMIKIDNEYKDKENSLISILPRYEEFLSNTDLRENIDKALIGASEILFNDYIQRRNRLFDEFNDKANKFILHIELNLLQIFKESYNFEISKKKIIDILLIENPNEKKDKLSKIIADISTTISIDEFTKTVTSIYKEMFLDIYNEYKEKEKELEKEYLLTSEKLKANRLLEYYLLVDNSEAGYLESILNTEEMNLSIFNSERKAIIEKIDKYFEYSINEIKVISSFEKIYKLFEHHKNLITFALNYELSNSIYELKKDLNLEIIKLNYKDKSNRLLTEKLIKGDKLIISLLNYKVNDNRYNRYYFTKKFVIKLAYELYNQNYDMNTLDAKNKLNSIITKYDSMLVSLDTIYETQKELMMRYKSRHELLNLSNYKYALSLLNHRLLIADSLLETTVHEYKLRVDILEDIRSSSKAQANHQMSKVISIYLDDIKEINFLRDSELKNLETEISYLKNKTFDDQDEEYYKSQNEQKLISIVEKYDNITKKLNIMLKHDPNIYENTLNIETLDKVTVELINDAQIIRDESLKDALRSIEKSHESFDNLLKSLETTKIDFKLVLDDYELIYKVERQKIESKLNDESDEYIELLRTYNEQYNLDYYYKEYNLLDKEHIAKHNELYNAYKNEIEIIERTSISDEYNDNLINESLKYSLSEENKKYEELLKNNTDDFFSKKDLEQKRFDEEINLINKDTIFKSKETMNECIKIKDSYSTVLNELKNDELESIRTLKRILKTIRSSYSFEISAIKDNYNNKIKEIIKNVTSKYKDIDVYALKGDNDYK